MKSLLLFLTLLLPFTFTAGDSSVVEQLIINLQNEPEEVDQTKILLQISGQYFPENPELSLDYAQLALDKAIVLQNADLQYDAYCQIAEIYNHITSFDLALKHYNEALLLVEGKNEKKMSNVLNEIGGVYYNYNDYNNAKKYFGRALKVRLKLGDKILIAGSYNNIAEIERLSGNYDKAIIGYEKALEINQELKNYRWQAINYSNIGLVHFDQGNLKEARKFVNKAVTIAEKLHHPTVLQSAILSLGDIDFHERKYYEAIENYKTAYDLSAEYRDIYNLKYAALGLSNSFNQLGDFKKALDFHLEYTKLKDSIFNENKLNQVIFVQNYFESQRRKKEIEALQYKNMLNNAELEKQEQTRMLYVFIIVFVLIIAGIAILANRTNARKKRQLSKALDEKVVLIQEIHHRVKNNLQIISSLLNLQSYKIENPIALKSLEDSKSRVNSMALVHQKLYESGNFAELEFKKYVEQLIQSVAESYSEPTTEVSWDLKISDLKVDLDTAIPLGLIMTELMTNSFKHAFVGRNKGVISTTFTQEGDSYLLHYYDDGIGFSNDFITDKEQSLGMEIISALIEQISGRIECYSDKGANYKITFNLK